MARGGGSLTTESGTGARPPPYGGASLRRPRDPKLQKMRWLAGAAGRRESAPPRGRSLSQVGFCAGSLWVSLLIERENQACAERQPLLVSNQPAQEAAAGETEEPAISAECSTSGRKMTRESVAVAENR